MYNPKKKQWKTLNKFLKENDSFVWDQIFGWYSDGSFTIEGYWNFDLEKTKSELNIDINGNII